MTLNKQVALELADVLADASAEALAWAQSPANAGADSQTMFVAQVAVSGTLDLIVRELRAKAAQP
jgi:hypothetical protein